MSLINKFNDLATIDSEKIVEMLYQVGNLTLVTALSHCHENTVARIENELGPEAGPLLRKDVEYARSILHPSDAAFAQKQILELLNADETVKLEH